MLRGEREGMLGRPRRVPGQGVDEAPEERPGVPREHPAKPDPGAHWESPQRQLVGLGVLEHTGIDRPTPVYGTAEPPRLLSGILRRLAYGIPDHRTPHWLLLMAADRVDVLEHRVASVVVWLPAAAAALVGYLLVSRSLRRRAE